MTTRPRHLQPMVPTIDRMVFTMTMFPLFDFHRRGCYYLSSEREPNLWIKKQKQKAAETSFKSIAYAQVK